MPRLGVGVIIRKPGTDLVLMGIRTGSHGAGQLAFPGGKVEFGDDPRVTAIEETMEEAGIVVTRADGLPWWGTDLFPEDQKHFLTLYILATEWSGEPVVMEPDKCLGWEWVKWGSIPTESRELMSGTREFATLYPDLDALAASAF